MEREVCDPLLPWLCENSEIRADILMMALYDLENQEPEYTDFYLGKFIVDIDG